MYELRDKFQEELATAGDTSPDLEQFHAALELFYPGSRRGAAGPLERTAEFDGPGADLDDFPSATDDDELAMAGANDEQS
jgi:hypothetical protein